MICISCLLTLKELITSKLRDFVEKPNHNNVNNRLLPAVGEDVQCRNSIFSYIPIILTSIRLFSLLASQRPVYRSNVFNVLKLDVQRNYNYQIAHR
jgi:hypothetical protein